MKYAFSNQGVRLCSWKGVTMKCLSSLLWAAFVLTLIFAGCESGDSDDSSGSVDETPSDGDSILPTPTGTYCVGVTPPIHLVDESRLETITEEDTNDQREVMVQIWYPVDAGAEGAASVYMDDETAETILEQLQSDFVILGVLLESLTGFQKKIQTHGLLDAPISAKFDRWPVLLFSPGWRAVFQEYASLLEDAASHGYMIVAINHPHFSSVTIFPDGRKVINTTPRGDETSAFIDRHFEVLSADMSFVRDRLESLEDNDILGRFAGRIDLNQVGVFGHSLGGAAAVEASRDDDRFYAAIGIDGKLHGEVLDDERVLRPLHFVLSESSFALSKTISSTWNKAEKGYFAELSGMQHVNFTDLPLLLSYLAPTALDGLSQNLLDMIGIGTIDPEHALELANTCNMAFFDTYLRQAPLEDFLSLTEGLPGVTFLPSHLPSDGTEVLSGSGAIGEACSTNADCKSYFCLTTDVIHTIFLDPTLEVPGGLCSGLNQDVCSSDIGGAAMNLGFLGEGFAVFDLCLSPCESVDDCRTQEGYDCFDPSGMVEDGLLSVDEANNYFHGHSFCIPPSFSDVIKNAIEVYVFSLTWTL